MRAHRNAFGLVTTLLVLSSWLAVGQPSELAGYSADRLPGSMPRVPDGVTVSVDTADAAEGTGAYRIQYEGSEPVSLTLHEVPLTDIEDCVLLYEAQMRCSDVTGRAYLEMLCVFEGRGEFFSRALDDTFTGTCGWRKTRTPFFLKKGQRPTRVRLGVRFEGPGVVWLDGIALKRAARGGLGAANLRWEWIPGTLLGVVLGLWGSVAGVCASLGRGRRAIVASAVLFLIASAGMLAAALALLAAHRPFDVWYPWLLPGSIGVVITGVMIPVIRRAYRRSEARRMAAMDLGDSIR